MIDNILLYMFFFPPLISLVHQIKN